MNTDSHSAIASFAPAISRPQNSSRPCWARRYSLDYTLRDVGSAQHDGVARLDTPAADGNGLPLEIHTHAGSSAISVRSDRAREIAHDYPWALSETTDR